MRQEREGGLLPAARSSDLPVELFVGTPEPGETASGRRVSFSVRIPVVEMEFEERGEDVEALLELTFVSTDVGGARSEPQTIRVPVRMTRVAWGGAMRGVWTYKATLLSEKGDLRFVVTARDLKTNRIGSAEVSARVD